MNHSLALQLQWGDGLYDNVFETCNSRGLCSDKSSRVGKKGCMKGPAAVLDLIDLEDVQAVVSVVSRDNSSQAVMGNEDPFLGQALLVNNTYAGKVISVRVSSANEDSCASHSKEEKSSSCSDSALYTIE